MFPMTITLTNVDQLVAVMGALKLTEPAAPAEAPGKPSAAPTARSPRTAEAAPSTPAPSAAAPETSAPPSAPTTAPAAAAPSAPADKPVDYPTLQKAVAKLFTKDKARCAAIPAELGKATYKELSPEQWPQALALVEAALAA